MEKFEGFAHFLRRSRGVCIAGEMLAFLKVLSSKIKAG